uniref:PhoH-like protein n=1 Tax=viral metagenome TaxID=1070528 RepID=A0A6C0CV12_9ZZZZ
MKSSQIRSSLTIRPLTIFRKHNKPTTCTLQPNPKQKEYIRNMDDLNIPLVLGVGPAGTGKTMFACKVAMEHLLENRIKKIIITRPVVPLGNELGFLPGTLEDKMDPWLVPIYDSMKHSMTSKSINQMVYNKTIEVCPLAYIRGRTFDDTFLIADEMQNSSIMEMKTLLTRVGKDSKVVLTGDLDQSDIEDVNGLEDLLLKLKKENDNNRFFKLIEFDNNDIERSELVKYILQLYSSTPLNSKD